jgi:SH3 domain protein
MSAKFPHVLIFAFCLLLAHTAIAEPAWVSDEFEITLRTGPSTSNAIEAMLPSGARLEVVERDQDSGYSRVRTAAGTEGWVLTRYLMDEPSAREQLQSLTGQLTDATSQGASLREQLTSIRSEYRAAQQRVEALEADKAELEEELAEIRRVSANTLAVNEENRTFREQLSAAQLRIETLEHESRQLASQDNRYWFIAGALVLLVGMILGLWLPRIRWQRRSRYERF